MIGIERVGELVQTDEEQKYKVTIHSAIGLLSKKCVIKEEGIV